MSSNGIIINQTFSQQYYCCY